MNNSKIDNVQPEQELNSEPAADVPTSSPSSTKPHVVRSAYYTPTVEEFHVGFEFEILNTREKFFIPNIAEGVWMKSNVCLGALADLNNILKLILDKQVRVECFHKEDIENFEFTLTNEISPFFGYNCYKKEIEYPKGAMDDYSTTFFIFIEGGRIKITRYRYGGFSGMQEENDCLFYGVVKNKSELKRLLQQVGCIPG